MRSVKSELYLFIKAIILGGTYEDVVYPGIPEVKHYSFWNNELTNAINKDAYPVPSVFFEIGTIESSNSYQNTDTSNIVSRTDDEAIFNLHLVMPKLTSETVETDYIDQIDLANEIYLKLQDRRFSRTQKIKKVSETPDNDSSVLMDWMLTFSIQLYNCPLSDTVDANDVNINPEAPVEKVVTVTFIND